MLIHLNYSRNTMTSLAQWTLIVQKPLGLWQCCEHGYVHSFVHLSAASNLLITSGHLYSTLRPVICLELNTRHAKMSITQMHELPVNPGLFRRNKCLPRACSVDFLAKLIHYSHNTVTCLAQWMLIFQEPLERGYVHG